MSVLPVLQILAPSKSLPCSRTVGLVHFYSRGLDSGLSKIQFELIEIIIMWDVKRSAETRRMIMVSKHVQRPSSKGAAG